MILYGGQSGEHEISLLSAASVIRSLDRSRFEILPVGIDKRGKWSLNSMSSIDLSKRILVTYPSSHEIIPCSELKDKVDVVFPVMHGTLCEDGAIQGLFELVDLPYVGANVLGSAIGMDKDVAKRLARDAGLLVTPYQVIREGFKKEEIDCVKYPVFVKPACLGSSLGVHKVKESSELEPALKDAFSYCDKILIEKAISAREIELSVLESVEQGVLPRVSQPGEIVPSHEFYSYEAKYLDEQGAKLLVPASLDAQQILDVQRIACEAFQALECGGMARVDLFLDQRSGEFYFNELNTIPGFTAISMYPKLWEYSGLPYTELLSCLIDLALLRHQRKRRKMLGATVSYDS